MSSQLWEFWIDVGGTFTDCVARAPDDSLHTHKTLSSGVVKGDVEEFASRETFVDPSRRGGPADYWAGFRICFRDENGATSFQSEVVASEPARGRLTLRDAVPHSIQDGASYELTSGEEAPVLAIRSVLGLRLDEAIPPVVVKLGTTRGTNALLERKGARTAFITTAGFADVLLIGNQARPRLFDLAIEKPEPLFERVVEIDERLDASGRVLQTPDPVAIERQLAELTATGVESIAICLLHSFENPAHEQLVERLAREAGFAEVSTSSRLSPLIKIVSRGDTTVMDAYLNPILREYVGGIRDSLRGQALGVTPMSVPHRESPLKLMTSAGGLVDAERFVGKDSILSGPAGGVIGFSRVAEAAGFPKSIGFDMGGTSTDVARFDGEYEREYETEKAGVRVVAPMLAIETVAAGGGSVCGFDGVKLFVGPDSAGADPGPACYGKGGPLTVTDVNLYLGKILPDRFPFRLDAAAVESRLAELCEHIARSPLGTRYTPVELAEGFVRIANANMVRAIRKISVAKGYDPADYALVTFGGAGAQHACAIAASLGIESILVHPYAGILSAYGIGLADVRRFGERAVLKECTPETLANLEDVFTELEGNAVEEIRAEGVPEKMIDAPTRLLDMRYRGVENTLTVAVPPCENAEDTSRLLISQYAELHSRLYGYRHDGREVEITAARVEAVGKMADPPQRIDEVQPRRPTPTETTMATFNGERQSTAVFLREDLRAGDEFDGPAILCEPTSTVVVDPGFAARITERGDVVIQHATARWADTHRSPAISQKENVSPDPVLLEIFNNLFASIAEQMGLTLQRTSFSTNVKERLDFSCAIFSPTGDLVVNAPHIPVHLGAMSETVKRVLADNPKMAAGDVFVTNDPYGGGSHLPDVTVVTPVHDAATSELLFFTASRAHHAEIGGIVPGSMPPFSKNLAEEGVLIRNFQLVDAGESREAELKELLTSSPWPTRAVADNLSDVAAQVAANNSGVRQLRELVERYSLRTVQAYMGHIQRAAAEKMRLALREIDDGEYVFTDHLDDGSPIAVCITVKGETATVDFTGTGPVLPTNLNANRAIVTAAVLYVFRCLIAEDIPLNSGVLEPVTIVLPECLLNPPAHADPAECAAMVGGNVETSQRVVDVLLGALGVAAASQGTMNNLTFGDDTFGYYETICGGSGATPDADGADAVHTHMTNTRLTDAEVIERRYPVIIRRFAVRKNSGGSGQQTGGDGIIREIEFLAPLKVSMLSERRGQYAPFGLHQGEPGCKGRNRLRRKGDDAEADLGGKFSIDAAPGDVLIIETPGGGGCGGGAVGR